MRKVKEKLKTKTTGEVYLSNNRAKYCLFSLHVAPAMMVLGKRELNFQGGKESHPKEVVEVFICTSKNLITNQ